MHAPTPCKYDSRCQNRCLGVFYLCIDFHVRMHSWEPLEEETYGTEIRKVQGEEKNLIIKAVGLKLCSKTTKRREAQRQGKTASGVFA